mmetsp:Transcript_5812/g.15602  ORF Transcript_5812/g.15602 Transcript_5812/m.15602 type:complete len:299 (+) Transcript_5812:318-1214(+)
MSEQEDAAGGPHLAQHFLSESSSRSRCAAGFFPVRGVLPAALRSAASRMATPPDGTTARHWLEPLPVGSSFEVPEPLCVFLMDERSPPSLRICSAAAKSRRETQSANALSMTLWSSSALEVLLSSLVSVFVSVRRRLNTDAARWTSSSMGSMALRGTTSSVAEADASARLSWFFEFITGTSNVSFHSGKVDFALTEVTCRKQFLPLLEIATTSTKASLVLLIIILSYAGRSVAFNTVTCQAPLSRDPLGYGHHSMEISSWPLVGSPSASVIDNCWRAVFSTGTFTLPMKSLAVRESKS